MPTRRRRIASNKPSVRRSNKHKRIRQRRTRRQRQSRKKLRRRSKNVTLRRTNRRQRKKRHIKKRGGQKGGDVKCFTSPGGITNKNSALCVEDYEKYKEDDVPIVKERAENYIELHKSRTTSSSPLNATIVENDNFNCGCAQSNSSDDEIGKYWMCDCGNDKTTTKLRDNVHEYIDVINDNECKISSIICESVSMRHKHVHNVVEYLHIPDNDIQQSYIQLPNGDRYKWVYRQIIPGGKGSFGTASTIEYKNNKRIIKIVEKVAISGTLDEAKITPDMKTKLNSCPDIIPFKIINKNVYMPMGLGTLFDYASEMNIEYFLSTNKDKDILRNKTYKTAYQIVSCLSKILKCLRIHGIFYYDIKTINVCYNCINNKMYIWLIDLGSIVPLNGNIHPVTYFHPILNYSSNNVHPLLLLTKDEPYEYTIIKYMHTLFVTFLDLVSYNYYYTFIGTQNSINLNIFPPYHRFYKQSRKNTLSWMFFQKQLETTKWKHDSIISYITDIIRDPVDVDNSFTEYYKWLCTHKNKNRINISQNEINECMNIPFVKEMVA